MKKASECFKIAKTEIICSITIQMSKQPSQSKTIQDTQKLLFSYVHTEQRMSRSRCKDGLPYDPDQGGIDMIWMDVILPQFPGAIHLAPVVNYAAEVLHRMRGI